VTDYADINEGAKIMDVVTVKLWGGGAVSKVL